VSCGIIRTDEWRHLPDYESAIYHFLLRKSVRGLTARKRLTNLDLTKGGGVADAVATGFMFPGLLGECGEAYAATKLNGVHKSPFSTARNKMIRLKIIEGFGIVT